MERNPDWFESLLWLYGLSDVSHTLSLHFLCPRPKLSDLRESTQHSTVEGTEAWRVS